MKWKEIKRQVITESKRKKKTSDDVCSSLNHIEEYIISKTPKIINSIELLLQTNKNVFKEKYQVFKNGELHEIDTWCINEIYNQLIYKQYNNRFREILKLGMIYCVSILLIQYCNSWVTNTIKYFHTFNADLLFNFIIWCVICFMLGIYCYWNRVINFKVSVLIAVIYLTLRFFKELHPDWYFITYRKICYMDILVGILLIASSINCYKPQNFRMISYVYRFIFSIKEKINQIKRAKGNKETAENQHFATISDNPIKHKNEDRFAFYEEAELFLDKLLEQSASYQEHALIVGLEGEWGTGKTSFINMIECAISDSNKYSNFRLINFSSWNYRNANQLTVELLSTISEVIGIKEITKVIDKYIKVFEGTPFHWLTRLTSIFCKEAKTTIEYFNDVNEKLRDCPLTLIIAVDDIDRLVKEEILEVLKLVRNTANFRKIVYVIAYDKDYVEQTLKECSICEPQKYLEKIFNVPFLLPEKSKKQKVTLYKEILYRNIFWGRTDQTEKGIDAFVEQFGEHLSTRNVKRLAKQLQLNTPFIREDGMSFDLDIYDTLILYYLNIKYKPMFEKLKRLSYEIKKTYKHPKELIYCSGGYIFMNLADKNKDYIDYTEKYIVPIVGTDNADFVLELIKGLFKNSESKSAYSISYADVYPIFFTRTFPNDYVKIKDFIDASKKATFPKILKEWNNNKNRSMLRLVISYLRYEDYTETEFISMFKDIISEVTIKEFWTQYSIRPPQDRTFCIIPGINYKQNWNSENYRNVIKKIIENTEYDNVFSQRFTLLLHSETYKYIYERDYYSYISICNKYLDVYLSYKNKFDDFNYDFWSMPLSIYNGTHNDKDLNIIQEKCKTHILQHINSFAENWSKNKENHFLACVFCTPIMIPGYMNGGWQDLFYKFIQDNKDKIDEYTANLFYDKNEV